MYRYKLRNQNKNIIKNISKNKENDKQQQTSAMDKSNSPVQKRLREINQISLSDNTPKLCRCSERESLYLNNTNSPLKGFRNYLNNYKQI